MVRTPASSALARVVPVRLALHLMDESLASACPADRVTGGRVPDRTPKADILVKTVRCRMDPAAVPCLNVSQGSACGAFVGASVLQSHSPRLGFS